MSSTDLTTEYNIVEIFPPFRVRVSQRHTARLRRFGNLRCEWCDTNFDDFETQTVESILSEVEQYPCKNIVFTGSEPMLNDLCRLLVH